MAEARSTAGILLLAIVAVETGGVLVIRSLVVQLYADAAGLDGALAAVARNAVPLAAILMPAGFFFSSMGEGRTEPNRFVWLLYAGAVSLGLGVTALGIRLLTS